MVANRCRGGDEVYVSDKTESAFRGKAKSILEAMQSLASQQLTSVRLEYLEYRKCKLSNNQKFAFCLNVPQESTAMLAAL